MAIFLRNTCSILSEFQAIIKGVESQPECMVCQIDLIPDGTALHAIEGNASLSIARCRIEKSFCWLILGKKLQQLMNLAHTRLMRQIAKSYVSILCDFMDFRLAIACLFRNYIDQFIAQIADCLCIDQSQSSRIQAESIVKQHCFLIR